MNKNSIATPKNPYTIAVCSIKTHTAMKDLTFDKLPEAVAGLYPKLNSIEKILLDQNHNTKPEADELLTVQQAADFLNLSVPTVYGYVQRQEVPVCKRAKRLYFSRNQLTDWIKGGRKKTISEISEEAASYVQPKKKGGKR